MVSANWGAILSKTVLDAMNDSNRSYSMLNNVSDKKLPRREQLYNVCADGHEQQVHHQYCSVCGKTLDRLYIEHSWKDIRFDAGKAFMFISETNRSVPSKAFISSFDNNLLVVFEDRQCIFIKDIPFSSESTQIVKEFTINSLSGLVDNIYTDNRHIYIHNQHKLFLLDWIDLLNANPDTPEVCSAIGKTSGITYHKKLYFYSETKLHKIIGKDYSTIANLTDNDIIHAVDTFQEHLIMVGKKASGKLFLRANDFHNPDTITQDVIMPFSGEDMDVIATIGKEFYAFSPDRHILFVGKLAGLRTNQMPNYQLENIGCISKMFFIQNYLYVVNGDSILRWDMQNFTVKPDRQNSSVNLNHLPHSVNFDSSEICMPISQGQNDYISIVDQNLMQLSLSSGFPDPLIVFATCNNHVYAVTRNLDSIKIYIG